MADVCVLETWPVPGSFTATLPLRLGFQAPIRRRFRSVGTRADSERAGLPRPRRPQVTTWPSRVRAAKAREVLEMSTTSCNCSWRRTARRRAKKTQGKRTAPGRSRMVLEGLLGVLGEDGRWVGGLVEVVFQPMWEAPWNQGTSRQCLMA